MGRDAGVSLYTSEYLDEVRARVPFREIVGRHVKLRTAGAILKGLCPFHNEKTPSFVVYLDHAHCYGCGAHVDAIGFVMLTEGVSFSDAVQRLAGVAGLGAPKAIDAKRARRDQADRRAREARERAVRQRAHDQVAQDTVRRLKLCTLGVHEYLANKGFLDMQGWLTAGGDLIVPLWNAAGNIRSAQSITPAGEKRFPKNAEIGGNFHRIGHQRGRQEVWLVEGFATGLSVHAALRARSRRAEVRVCFNSGNLQRVGLEAVRAGAVVYSVADHDWARCPNKHRWDGGLVDLQCPECGKRGTPPAGEKVAAAVRRPYWMPATPGNDANDVHREQGLDALADALRIFWMEAR